MKKFLFCNKCLSYPDEVYAFSEKREVCKWNGECYSETGITDEMDITGYECPDCLGELEEVEYDNLPNKIKQKMVLKKC